MTEIAPSTPRAPLWSRIWHFLRAIDEAIHTTELDVIFSRLDRLERAVIELREPEVPRNCLAKTSDCR
jgi:hypothetical protein